MPQQQILYFEKPHDPNAVRRRMFKLLPDEGVSITSATVTVVDAEGHPVLGTDLVISDVAFALLPDGSGVWGVSFIVSGGTAGKKYLICLHFTTSESPTEADDITMRLSVQHT